MDQHCDQTNFDMHKYTVKGYDSRLYISLDETFEQTMDRKYAFPYKASMITKLKKLDANI